MSSQPVEELLHVIFTEEDVLAIADDLGIDPEVALGRARDWAKALEEGAVQRLNELLASIVEHNQP